MLQETFDQYRAAELKHGRVAMLAVVGYVVAETTRFPGEIAPGLKFADVPNGVAALEAIPALGWAQVRPETRLSHLFIYIIF